jgi:type II restriction enzyme
MIESINITAISLYIKKMESKLPVSVAKDYSSRSQQIRVVSEFWVKKSVFCPNCGDYLNNFENNKPVADFYCVNCSEEYELKSKHGVMGRKIVNGAYLTMIERLESNNNPNFFFLTYDKNNFTIKNFLAIPKYFFTPNIIEKRKPLNITARRAGWVGCNIIVNSIPDFGKIFYIQNGVVISKEDVLYKWNRTEFIKHSHDIEARGWMLDILICIERIKEEEFSLEEVYEYESFLKAKHPYNNNIKAKIRQQLQFLRDRKIINFLGHGKYRKNNFKI